ncbi:MAG: gamma-glutamylcyclotransferase family protein [Candidatus Hodarchaeota archaeon]
MKRNNNSFSLYSVVGYGTFITRDYWRDKRNVEVCLVKNFIRIFPKGNWFPYVLPYKGASFYGLKFDVTHKELSHLDFYEGVSESYYDRKLIDVVLKNKKNIKAFLYIPSERTISSENLTLDLDKNDRWKEEIRKYPEIIKKFPELIL